MEIKRESYLEQLISYRFDCLVKIVTGIGRCVCQYDSVVYIVTIPVSGDRHRDHKILKDGET